MVVWVNIEISTLPRRTCGFPVRGSLRGGDSDSVRRIRPAALLRRLPPPSSETSRFHSVLGPGSRLPPASESHRLTKLARVMGWYCSFAAIGFLLAGLLVGPEMSDTNLRNIEKATVAYVWWRDFLGYQVLFVLLPSLVSVVVSLGALFQIGILSRSSSSNSGPIWYRRAWLALALSAFACALAWIITPAILNSMK